MDANCNNSKVTSREGGTILLLGIHADPSVPALAIVFLSIYFFYFFAYSVQSLNAGSLSDAD
jgi:hypothetical protein